MSGELLIKNVRPYAGDLVDIVVRGGEIAEIGYGLPDDVTLVPRAEPEPEPEPDPELLAAEAALAEAEADLKAAEEALADARRRRDEAREDLAARRGA